MLVQGPPKKHKNHLHLNKLATLGANNFLKKRDASNFSSIPITQKSYGLSKSEKISRDTRVPKGPVWSKFQVTISRKRHGVKDFFLCVFIVATIDYSEEVSSKLEGVTWELFLKLVDLTWNDYQLTPDI